ncbi:hypothetical protein M885DRAFT_616452 [Pelagophyceae sp. CCMP2097]|nr:hypothetical protein M885DRAFT_616452 [Pelagophyceae sp. CCMP2097]
MPVETAHETEFKPQELANLSWAFAKGSMAAPALFHALAAECVSQMAEFPLQSLATVSWAFAKAGVEAPLLFRAVATHDLEDVAWAYSKEAGDSTDADKHGELLEAVATEATKSISTFPPSALANMVWIYAKSRAPELFKAVEAEASRKMSDFSAHSLAKLAWAYSTAGIAAPSLFLSIAEAALLKLGQFSAKDVATLALAFAKADAGNRRPFGAEPNSKPPFQGAVASPSLFDALASSSRSKMENFDAQSLTFLAWAFSKAEANPGLFDSIAEEAVLKIKTFDARNLSNLARAFAKAGVAAPALYEAIANEAETKVTAFSEKDLGVLAFAFRYSFARVQAPLLFQAAAVFETEYRQGREASSDDFDGQGTAEPSAAEYEADVASYDDAAGLEFSTSRGESRASFEATQRWQPDSSREQAAPLFAGESGKRARSLHPDLDSKRVDPKRRPAERRSEMRPAVRNIGDGNWQ